MTHSNFVALSCSTPAISRLHLLSLLPLLGLAAMGPMPAHAEPQKQSQQQIYETTYVQTSFGLGTQTAYPPEASFTVQPFDSSLGVLGSTTIRWQSSADGQVTVASGVGGGAWGLEFGGTVNVNSFPYNGYGGGNGYGAGPGQLITFSLPSTGRTDTFTSADATVWGAFTGPNPYTLAYLGSYPGGTPYRITSTNIGSGIANVRTNVEVTYTFTPFNPPAAAPGPVPLLGAAAAWRASRRLRQVTRR